MILARTVFFGVFNAWMHYYAILCIVNNPGSTNTTWKAGINIPKSQRSLQPKNTATDDVMSLQSVDIHLKTNAAFNSVALNCNVNTFVTQGLTACHMLFLAFLFYHILYCICFKILFTESKYLVSN